MTEKPKDPFDRVEKSDDTPNERVLLEAESTEAFVERRRYQDLFNAREAVRERLRNRPAALAEGHVDRDDLNEDLHAATRALVLEAEPLFRNTEFGKQLWTQRTLGPAHLSHAFPEHLDYANVVDIDASRLPSGVQVAGDRIQFSGIKPYANLSTAVVNVEIERPATHSRNPDAINKESGQVSLIPPKNICDDVFRATNELFTELGIMGKLGGEDYRADEPGA
jgi:hypothetical protein